VNLAGHVNLLQPITLEYAKLEWLQNSWNGQTKNSFQSTIGGTSKIQEQTRFSVENTVWISFMSGLKVCWCSSMMSICTHITISAAICIVWKKHLLATMGAQCVGSDTIPDGSTLTTSKKKREAVLLKTMQDIIGNADYDHFMTICYMFYDKPEKTEDNFMQKFQFTTRQKFEEWMDSGF